MELSLTRIDYVQIGTVSKGCLRLIPSIRGDKKKSLDRVNIFAISTFFFKIILLLNSDKYFAIYNWQIYIHIYIGHDSRVVQRWVEFAHAVLDIFCFNWRQSACDSSSSAREKL